MALPPSGSGQAGLIAPPLAHVDNLVQSRLVEGELAFMNDQPGFVLALQQLGNDVVEGHHLGCNLGRKQLQRQIRRWSWFPEPRSCAA